MAAAPRPAGKTSHSYIKVAARTKGELDLGPATGPIEYAPDREPWERQPRETDLAWSLFQYYRNTPPHRRKLSTVFADFVQAHPDTPGLLPAGTPSDVKAAADILANSTSTPTWFRDISVQYRWPDRAGEFDRWLDDVQRADIKYRREHIRAEIAALGQSLRSKALEALSAVKAVIYETTTDPTSGKVVVQLKPNLSPREITMLAKAGVELERFALGMEATGGIQVNVGVGINLDGGTVQQDDQELLLRARAVLASREGGVLALAGPDSPAAHPLHIIEGEYIEQGKQVGNGGGKSET